MTDSLDFISARELAGLVAARQVSPVELTQRALARAEATQASLNAFCLLLPEQALSAARRAESAVIRGEPLGSLHGLPISVKDLISIAGLPYASGSRAMGGNLGKYNAPAVERVRAEGAIIIGKTTTSEFGCKPVGDSPLTGVTRHPWDLDKTPGGSSAGAAASVAAGITPFALGTDGGGSLRIPAAFTGLVGFKASFGRIPVWPTSATPTLAHVGALARNVGDAALLTRAIAGYDARDPFSLVGPAPDFVAATEAPVKGLRIAWSPSLGYAHPEKEVVEITTRAARALSEQGAHVEEVDTVFDQDPAGLWRAEFYAGVGTRLKAVLETRRELLDPAVAKMLDIALAQKLHDYYAAVFERYEVRERMRRFFSRYDLLLSPTLPISALDAGRDLPPGHDDEELVTWAAYTYPFNLTGQPAASVCAGLTQAGMPVGIQVVGKTLGEHAVLSVAAALERIHPPGYNLRMP